MTTYRDVVEAVRRVTRSYLFGAGITSLSVLWCFRGVAGVKDLEIGDTASYYISALQWANEKTIDPLWSPAYTASVGTLHLLLGDAYDEQLVVRIFAVMACALGVFTAARALVRPYLAIAAAIAFSANPVLYDALYTVHIFAAIFPVVAIALAIQRANYRLLALTVLSAGAFLARNEFLLLAAAYFSFLVASLLNADDKRSRLFPTTRTARWVSACAIVILISTCALFALRSSADVNEIREGSARKHSLNVCQVYAFYMAQSAQWSGDPWLGCQEIMRSTFGADEPTLRAAATSNFAAFRAFLVWNARLIPSGFELLTTAHQSTGPSPDYVEHARSDWSRLGAMAVALLALVGLARVFSAEMRRTLSYRRSDFVTITGAVLTLSTFIALTQRPRPSYLFPALAVVVLLAIMGVASATKRLKRETAGEALIVLVVASASLLFIPQHFDDSYVNVFSGPGQPLLSQYRAIQNGTYSGGVVDPVICPYVTTKSEFCDPPR